MTDEAGAVPAAAETVAQPQAEPATSAPEAQAEAPAPSARAKEPARASIDRAFAALEKGEAAPEAKPKPAEKAATEKPAAPVTDTGERQRDEGGRFVAKEQTQLTGEAAPLQPEAKASTEQKPQTTTAFEPPPRFSADAKAAWKDAPEPIKAEITRAVRELETGLTQYQQAFEPLKPYFQLAQQHGITVDKALEQYINVDRALVSNDPNQKFAAIEHLFQHAGISPRDWAAQILGQPADHATAEADAVIRDLQRTNTQLQRELQAFQAAQQAEHMNTTEKMVDDFAKEHPRLQDDKFADTVARLIKTGLADDLPSAYELADRLNPAAASQAQAAKPVPAQPGKGSLSITGAPSSGSNPVNRKPPSTARESVDRAFASLGLG
jgi:hypothetical protein